MNQRFTKTLGPLLAALLLVSGCDSTTNQNKAVTPTLKPNATATPPATSTAAVFPTATPPRTETAIAVIEQPTPTPDLRTFGEIGIFEPTGADPRAQAIVEQWESSAHSLKSLKGTQEIMEIHLDGTLEPRTHDTYSNVYATEETWVLSMYGAKVFTPARFNYKAVNNEGFLMTVFDGQHDYLWHSVVPDELYQFLPENKSRSDIVYTSLNEESFVQFLSPETGLYSLVGMSTIDGHAVIELHEHKVDRIENADLIHIFLDANTYLPYRYVIDPTKDKLGVQRTMNMTINEPVSDSEIVEGLPDQDRVTTLFMPNPSGLNAFGKLPGYPTFQDASLNCKCALFAPSTGLGGSGVNTYALVQRNGVKDPIYMFFVTVGDDRLMVLEGRYLPETNLMHSPRDSNILETVGDPITIGGVQGTILSNKEYVHIRFQRDGTWIQVGAPNRDEALQVAESMQPVP